MYSYYLLFFYSYFIKRYKIVIKSHLFKKKIIFLQIRIREIFIELNENIIYIISIIFFVNVNENIISRKNEKYIKLLIWNFINIVLKSY